MMPLVLWIYRERIQDFRKRGADKSRVMLLICATMRDVPPPLPPPTHPPHWNNAKQVLMSAFLGMQVEQSCSKIAFKEK